MPPRHCCCDAECEIGRDDFMRADANPPTGRWIVIDGEWEIIDETLRSIEDGIILTTYRQPPPRRGGNGYNTRFEVDLLIPAEGDAEFEVVTAYRNETDYSYIHFFYNSANGELIPTFYSSPGNAVMDVTSHPEHDLWSATPGEPIRLVFCNAFAEWVVSGTGLQGDVIWQTCDGGLNNLPSAPLGGVGFRKGHFDNWVYEQHWESRIDCDRCQCFCVTADDPDNYLCIPEVLLLTILRDGSLGPYTCCVDGLELELYQSDPDVSGTDPVYNLTARKNLWYSQTFICNGERMWFILTCPVGVSSPTLSLVTYPQKITSAGSGALQIEPETEPLEGSSCNPMNLIYGPLTTVPVTCDVLDEFGNPIQTGFKPAACDFCTPDEPTTPTWTAYVTELL